MFVKQTFKQHAVAIVLGLIVILLALAGDNMTELLRYQASTIKTGEVWRLLSGNLVHLGWSHTGMNLLGLALIWALFWSCFNQRQWWGITLISGLSVGLGLLFLNPELNWYVGLSGILHGLFLAGAIGGMRRGEYREAFLLVAIIGKIIWEQFAGSLPGSAEIAGGPVIVDAHLYGAVGGILAALLFKPLMRHNL